ncbi:MAG: rhomboid family intramembrane serine protease [Polyangiaceae bacterium]|nr:rhomboid family intramembrane serine protease [Polyangiaceae bacterium]MCW5791512.1 rhomboid family intramembrane serine protease [Polyangiaceae bacterium]
MAAPKCPYCGTLNSVSEPRCFQCGEPLPGPVGREVRRLLTTALGRDLWVTKLFLGLCWLGFALMLLDNARSSFAGLPLGMGSGGRIAPSAMLRAGVLVEPVVHEWWRYVTAVFFHFNLLHIAFNSVWLWSLGRTLEPELGSGRFTLLYLVTGVAGFGANALLGPMPLTGGASGAVFGLFGALVGYSLGRKSSLWREHLSRLVIFVVLSALLGAGMSGGGVNNAAHIGGAVAGVGVGFLFAVERRRPAAHRWFGYFGVLGVIAVVAALVATQLSPTWQAYREHVESPEGIW